MPLDPQSIRLIEQNNRLINPRKAQICTQAGAVSGAGNPKTGAEAGKVWVVAQGNHMPIQAYNAVALDMTLGIWVEIKDDRFTGEAEITAILVAENAQKGGDAFVALAAKGPRSSETDIKVNWNATAAPTTTDDVNSGYTKYSLWIYNSIAYMCMDATASAAVWQKLGSMSSFTLAGDSGSSAITDGNTLSIVGAVVSGDTATVKMRPLAVNVTEVGNVGTGEDDLMTYTVAANTLGTNLDRLQIKAAGTFAAATVRLRAYLDDTLLFDTGSIAVAGAADWELDLQIIREAQSVQKCTAKFASSAAVLPVTANYAGAAEDLSTSLVFKLTAEATNNNDVVQELLTVDLVRAP